MSRIHPSNGSVQMKAIQCEFGVCVWNMMSTRKFDKRKIVEHLEKMSKYEYSIIIQLYSIFSENGEANFLARTNAQMNAQLLHNFDPNDTTGKIQKRRCHTILTNSLVNDLLVVTSNVLTRKVIGHADLKHLKPIILDDPFRRDNKLEFHATDYSELSNK